MNLHVDKNRLLSNHFNRVMDHTGVTDFYDSIDFRGDITAKLSNNWNQLDTRHKNLASLLILGQGIGIESLNDSILSDIIDLLSSLHLILKTKDLISLHDLALHRYRGIWFFSDAPQPSPTLYFGADSLGLARRLYPKIGGKALDLCSGPGIQALLLAQMGMKTKSVDINIVASKLCHLNATINGLDDMVVSATGNLYNALYPDDRYDLIVANPPLLPIPSGVPYPFVGDGGSDGLSIVREIIKGGSLKLLPDGEILIIGMTILRNGQIIPPLSEYLMNAGLSGVITIIASYGTGMEDSWVKGVALTSMLHAPDACKNQKDLQRLLAKGYRKMGADKVCTYILRGWPDAHPTFTVQNISGESDEQDPWMLF